MILVYVMVVSKSRICLTIDFTVMKAIHHLVERGDYKSVSDAFEKLVVCGIEGKAFDSMIDKLMDAFKR